MKGLLMFVLVIFCSFSGLISQTADIPFSYDRNKITSGKVNFYRVSDMDKGQGFDFIVYQGDEKTFYSFGDFSEIGPLVQVGNETYNTQIFCNDYGMNENPYSYAKMRI